MKNRIACFVFVLTSNVAFCQQPTPFNPYKILFIQPGVGLSFPFLFSQNSEQPITPVIPSLLGFSLEYGITKNWGMGISQMRVGYGAFEDSVTLDIRANNFTVRSFFSRPWALKKDNYLKTDKQMRRWFLGIGLSSQSFKYKKRGHVYKARTPCFQIGYDIKKKWGHRFFYGLCYGINAEYFYSFKDIDGKVLTKTNDPSVRFDLLEFGPFCTFSFGLMINTGKKISR